MVSNDADGPQVLSFYRYFPVADPDGLVAALKELGARLELLGRTLIATEGVSGTCAGSASAVAEFIEQAGFAADWKVEGAEASGQLFPDWNVKLVNEIVGFGIAGFDVKVDSLDESTVARHLTPAEFDTELRDPDAVVIDVRNDYEYAVGHFAAAKNPNMGQTHQWRRYVDDNAEALSGKKVLMYCTGGVRCEKASAYLRHAVPTCEPFQLGGGIVRYLAHNPEGGAFQGTNFVFDRRSVGGEAECAECSECGRGGARVDGGQVCQVCTACVIVCRECDERDDTLGEYYCPRHLDFRGAFTFSLEGLDVAALEGQRGQLAELMARAPVRQKGKNRRATLRKKIAEVEARLAELGAGAPVGERSRMCRVCKQPFSACPGRCWGFWKDAPR